MEETFHVWGLGVYKNSLYLPLNFALYLKLLKKTIVLIIIIKVQSRNLSQVKEKLLAYSFKTYFLPCLIIYLFLIQNTCMSLAIRHFHIFQNISLFLSQSSFCPISDHAVRKVTSSSSLRKGGMKVWSVSPLAAKVITGKAHLAVSFNNLN